MRSSDDGMSGTPGVELGQDTVWGRRDNHKPVWVQLGRLYVRDHTQPIHHNPEGVDYTGQVPGTLRAWIPTYHGRWLAVVSYGVPYADRRRQRLWWQEQVLPDYAVTPREHPSAEPSTDT
jgi:hypothetical protein